jgi:endoglucanase
LHPCPALCRLGFLVSIFAFVALRVPAQGTGYWHTSGSQILDSKNEQVRIAGIDWYGFETTDAVAHGLYSQDYQSILKTIAAQGYNTIRLPFSNQMVETPTVPTSIQFSNPQGAINTDLKGLNSLQIMDKVIAGAGKLGLRVILDDHRSEAGNSNQASGLWYTSQYPESNWIADWKMLAARYKTYKDASGNPTVIGVDLRNEPHLIDANGGKTGSCWTGDTSTGGCPAAQNWTEAAARAGNAVLAANASLLIFVEGTDCYNGDCGWQGANLEGAGKYPVKLAQSGRLVYSAHDYGPDLYPQSWFNGATTAASLAATWTKYWGYLSTEGMAPVWLGEFGTTNATGDIENNSAGSQGQWFACLVGFLAAHPSIQWTYWALNGEDMFGLLDNNYDATPVSSIKQQKLETIEFRLGGGVQVKSCEALPAVPGSLAAAVNASSESSEIHVSWHAVSAPANCSVAYNVYRSTTSGFTASASNQVATGLAATAFDDSGLAPGTRYYYRVQAADADGSSAASAQASATTKAQAVTPGTGCHVAYTIVSQWNTGFQGAIAITNTGSAAMTSWTVKWTFGGNQQISSAWNVTEAQSGETVTMSNLSYNGSIAPGGTVSGMGFTANDSGTNTVPASFTVNEVHCK